MTVAGVATWWPSTHTAARPITPLTMSVAVWPGCSGAVKPVRHHHGTANRGTVSWPTWLM